MKLHQALAQFFSTLFCQEVDNQRILDTGREILEAFLPDGRLIFNVGDLPAYIR
jgi:hypothetical protein